MTKEISTEAKDCINNILEACAHLGIELEAASTGNKAAAARARKLTLEVAALGKEFRRVSVRM